MLTNDTLQQYDSVETTFTNNGLWEHLVDHEGCKGELYIAVDPNHIVIRCINGAVLAASIDLQLLLDKIGQVVTLSAECSGVLEKIIAGSLNDEIRIDATTSNHYQSRHQIESPFTITHIRHTAGGEVCIGKYTSCMKDDGEYELTQMDGLFTQLHDVFSGRVATNNPHSAAELDNFITHLLEDKIASFDVVAHTDGYAIMQRSFLAGNLLQYVIFNNTSITKDCSVTFNEHLHTTIGSKHASVIERILTVLAAYPSIETLEISQLNSERLSICYSNGVDSVGEHILINEDKPADSVVSHLTHYVGWYPSYNKYRQDTLAKTTIEI